MHHRSPWRSSSITSSSMDLVIFSVIFSTVAFFFSLALLFLITTKKLQSSATSSMLPPGSTGWLIVGESLEFLNAGLRGVPDKFITDRMQKFSSRIFRTSLFGEAVAVLCGPEGNKFLFSNQNKLVTVWWPPSLSKIFFPSAQSANGEGPLKGRIMLLGFLKVEPLHKHVSTMDAMAKKFVKESFDNQKEVTILPLVKSYTFSIASKLFMSIDNPVLLANFLDLISVLVSGMVSLPIDLPGTQFNRAIKASNLLRKKMLEIVKQRKSDIAERKALPVQDMLSHVLVTSDESGQFMEDHDIAEKILGLLIAGHDTTSSAITFVIKYLAELPHVYDEVHKEQVQILNAKTSGDPLNWDDIQNMRYSWNVACEVMRLVPPTHGFFREALTAFTYDGFYIPKGWKLFWSTYSTHKSPTYFPEPEKFDPSRFEGNGPAPYTFVAFGGGPRMCPGKEYVRLVILVFMHNIVTKFKWEKVLYREKIVVNPVPMPVEGLPVQLKPHVY